MYRFSKYEKLDLIKYINELFKQKNNLLILKIKSKGFRSEHINITSMQELNDFINNVDDVFEKDNEIWVVSSSVIECWRCRIYLSADFAIPDKVEMAFSVDDHILDHLQSNNFNTPYLCFEKSQTDNSFKLVKQVGDCVVQAENIVKDIMQKYKNEFKAVKKDLEFLQIQGISLDCRVNDGYDFHDFDVSYEEIPKVIQFYVSSYINNKK